MKKKISVRIKLTPKKFKPGTSEYVRIYISGDNIPDVDVRNTLIQAQNTSCNTTEKKFVLVEGPFIPRVGQQEFSKRRVFFNLKELPHSNIVQTFQKYKKIKP